MTQLRLTNRRRKPYWEAPAIFWPFFSTLHFCSHQRIYVGGILLLISLFLFICFVDGSDIEDCHSLFIKIPDDARKPMRNALDLTVKMEVWFSEDVGYTMEATEELPLSSGWIHELLGISWKNWPWPGPATNDSLSYFELNIPFQLIGGNNLNWMTNIVRSITISSLICRKCCQSTLRKCWCRRMKMDFHRSATMDPALIPRLNPPGPLVFPRLRPRTWRLKVTQVWDPTGHWLQVITK